MTKRKTSKSLPPSDSQAEGSQAVPVEIVEPEELTEEESRLRLHLERKVERAFYEAGKALMELRKRRLFRSSHKTFEEYCKDRFGYSRRQPYYLIDAAAVVDNICEKCEPMVHILPTNERQVRPLTQLEPDLQREVWQQAVIEAGDKVPSGRIVKEVVERLKEKPLFKACDFCQVGDVFVLTRLEAKERKYNGCWAIAVALNDFNDFTVEVAVHDNTLSVHSENLNKIDSPEAQHQLPQIKERIRLLRNCGELESLGRQSYLTELQWYVRVKARKIIYLRLGMVIEKTTMIF